MDLQKTRPDLSEVIHCLEHTSKHLLLLFSDTGGGHRSAAEAIREEFDLEYEGEIRVEMVDFLKESAPRPLNRLPDLYPYMVRMPRAWKLGYRLSDGQRRTQLLIDGVWPYVRKRVRTLINRRPWGLVVSVHPLANALFLKALGPQRPPFITVVTDLVSTHAFWYDHRADLCIVPTEPARRQALAHGMKLGQVQVVGLPVARRFNRPSKKSGETRTRLGWPRDRPAILLMGGGDGMGPLETTARAIGQSGLPITLVVVTGRNQRLRDRLTAGAISWNTPTHIYGFVRDMPSMMAAADILVTKAGPGTLSEAFSAGLPLVLYNYLPGQEEGNIAYVESNEAGVWAPAMEDILAAIRRWIFDPGAHQSAARASRALARPTAAEDIARILAASLTQETHFHQAKDGTKV